ncbi:hypothetical protein [Clostridium thermobutyricum]|uniref:Uncharacterized protein n=1 Tax=Clostridium thermobutyricum DSM 4928 TaxID=1121339 RepID=A0A1V4SW57_9CLOT|nr:hypothetical protein [Clostridium thermobutyricum]OPX47837.1 hypothetical protein CLTHE_14080 [Clostridium thermobutyricum DSM 4928]
MKVKEIIKILNALEQDAEIGYHCRVLNVDEIRDVGGVITSDYFNDNEFKYVIF